MLDIILFAILGAILLGAAGYYGYRIIVLKKMPDEAKKKRILAFLYGAVSLAEKEIGSGNGAQKLAQVQGYFEKEAPVALRLLLTFLNKDSLTDLIEEALQELKENFKG